MISEPHHDGSALYVSAGNPRLTEHVNLRIRVPETAPAAGVWVRSVQDGEPRFDQAQRLGTAEGWTWWQARLLMGNPVTRYRFLLELDTPGAAPEYQWLNGQGLFHRDVSDYADFRLTTFAPAGEWTRRSVMYQIFPDRFARSAAAAQRPVPSWAVAADWNDEVIGEGPHTPFQYYGGDLAGIRDRLDDLAALGADVIYLTPFFPGQSNHRYDAATFEVVDPLLGGDQALIELVEAAHARGLRVIGDLTANHTGSSHEWFRRAVADPDSEEAGYYYFGADGSYVSWWGVPSLPKLNWASEALRRRFIHDEDAVVARWLRPPFNLDGWRMDVGNMTGRLGGHDFNHEVARLIAERIRGINPGAMLLAESTGDAAPDFSGEGWQGAMTYSNFTRPLWCWLTRADPGVNFFGTPLPGPNRISAEDFLATHRDLSAAYSWNVRCLNMNALSTHDTARAATVMVCGGQLVGAAMMFTLPGIPVVFAGEEFGLQGRNGEYSRTPMPWDAPERIRTDLRADYGALAALHRAQPALTEGSLRWLHAEGDVLAYIRETADSAVLVLAARADFEGVRLDRTVLSAAQLAALAAEPSFASGPVRRTTTAAVASVLCVSEPKAVAPGTAVLDAAVPDATALDALAPDAVTLAAAGPGAYIWVLPGAVLPPETCG